MSECPCMNCEFECEFGLFDCEKYLDWLSEEDEEEE